MREVRSAAPRCSSPPCPPASRSQARISSWCEVVAAQRLRRGSPVLAFFRVVRGYLDNRALTGECWIPVALPPPAPLANLFSRGPTGHEIANNFGLSLLNLCTELSCSGVNPF